MLKEGYTGTLGEKAIQSCVYHIVPRHVNEGFKKVYFWGQPCPQSEMSLRMYACQVGHLVVWRSGVYIYGLYEYTQHILISTPSMLIALS